MYVTLVPLDEDVKREPKANIATTPSTTQSDHLGTGGLSDLSDPVLVDFLEPVKRENGFPEPRGGCDEGGGGGGTLLMAAFYGRGDRLSPWGAL